MLENNYNFDDQEYQRKLIFNCDICGIDIFEDENYYIIEETFVCKECKADFIEANCKRRA